MLEPDEAHEATDLAAGVWLRTLELGWDDYEPTEGAFDAAYAVRARADYDRLEAAGFGVILDFGVQYPPAWAEDDPAVGKRDMSTPISDTIAEATTKLTPGIWLNRSTCWSRKGARRSPTSWSIASTAA